MGSFYLKPLSALLWTPHLCGLQSHGCWLVAEEKHFGEIQRREVGKGQRAPAHHEDKASMMSVSARHFHTGVRASAAKNPHLSTYLEEECIAWEENPHSLPLVLA